MTDAVITYLTGKFSSGMVFVCSRIIWTNVDMGLRVGEVIEFAMQMGVPIHAKIFPQALVAGE